MNDKIFKKLFVPAKKPARIGASLNYKLGFTLIETLIVLAVGVLLVSIAVSSLSSLRNTDSLGQNVTQVKAFLEQARALSISEKTTVLMEYR